jgi:hypothetical protein
MEVFAQNGDPFQRSAGAACTLQWARTHRPAEQSLAMLKQEIAVGW